MERLNLNLPASRSSPTKLMAKGGEKWWESAGKWKGKQRDGEQTLQFSFPHGFAQRTPPEAHPPSPQCLGSKPTAAHAGDQPTRSRTYPQALPARPSSKSCLVRLAAVRGAAHATGNTLSGMRVGDADGVRVACGWEDREGQGAGARRLGQRALGELGLVCAPARRKLGCLLWLG